METCLQFTENSLCQCFVCWSNAELTENVAHNQEIQELFKKTFKLEVQFSENLPQYLCTICQGKLNLAAEFLQQVESSLQYLEAYRKSEVELVKLNKDEKNFFSQNSEDSPKINVSIKKHFETDLETREDPPKDEISSEKNFEDLDNTPYRDNNTSDSDNEPLIKWSAKTKRKKRNLFNPKLERVPLPLVEAAIDEYREKYKENADCILCEFKGLNIRNLSCHMLFKHKEERNNWCLRCNAMVKDLESHKKTHTGRIWCKFCNKGVTRCHFMEHLKTHAGVEFSYEECCKRFIPQKSIEEHSRLHKQEKSFQCHVCQKPFKLFKNLEDHILTHGRYKCEICQKRFEIPELLASHFCSGKILKKDFEQKNEKSEIVFLPNPSEEDMCQLGFEGDQYEDESQSEQNSKTKMPEEFEIESLTCHFCQRSYKTAYKLQKHIEGHMGIFSAKCQYCDKGFSSKADLANHERVHTKEKPFICSSCGKGFVSGATLRIHMKQHTGKPEVCELCNKRFSRKSELKLHLQKHRGERPFLCTDCGKSFAQKSHLTCHLTMHSEERPYPCALCDKAFKKKELLKHHMKLHGEKSFKCTVCFYECHKKYRLQQHMKMHEGLKAGPKTNPCQLCNRSFSGVSLLNIHMGNAHNVIV
ncbi:zinc finger protein 431-like [Euwallacea similis]|uniref:zinc finger protein 431-like n=1 Tax=Euwallacea similis TaxID=1736056 RepID=UPI00345050F1